MGPKQARTTPGTRFANCSVAIEMSNGIALDGIALMPVIRCPRCGHGGEVPEVFRKKSVKCRKCATVFRVQGSRFFLKVAAGLLAVLLIATVSFFALQLFVRKMRDAVTPVPGEATEVAAAVEPDPSAQAKGAGDGSKQADELTQVAEELQSVEGLRDKLQSEQAALAKEKSQLERTAKEIQEKKARLAREEAELKTSAARKNPPLAKIEDIARVPDPYFGQLLAFEGATIQVKTLEKHKDVERVTLSIVSKSGTYYSRVPLGGLFFTTTDTIAAALPKHINSDSGVANVRLYCEIQKWEKKSAPGRFLPEARIYRVELFTIHGDLAKTLE
jgi:hypothetical protein